MQIKLKFVRAGEGQLQSACASRMAHLCKTHVQSCDPNLRVKAAETRCACAARALYVLFSLVQLRATRRCALSELDACWQVRTLACCGRGARAKSCCANSAVSGPLGKPCPRLCKPLSRSSVDLAFFAFASTNDLSVPWASTAPAKINQLPMGEMTVTASRLAWL